MMLRALHVVKHALHAHVTCFQSKEVTSPGVI